MPTLDDLIDVDAIALLALRRSQARREVKPTESKLLAHQVIELFHGRPLEIAVAAVHRAVAIIEKPLVHRASAITHSARRNRELPHPKLRHLADYSRNCAAVS